jgi:hypothetical protein
MKMPPLHPPQINSNKSLSVKSKLIQIENLDLNTRKATQACGREKKGKLTGPIKGELLEHFSGLPVSGSCFSLLGNIYFHFAIKISLACCFLVSCLLIF